MLNTKTKYTLLILAVLGFALTCYNHLNELTGTSFDSVELKFAKISLGLGISCAGLYFLNKNWQNILTKIMLASFILSLGLNLYIFPRVYENVRINKIYAEYSEIETCEEMERRFTSDLKNEKIKYFQFGIAYDAELAETLKNKYKIQSIGMGCTIQSEKECYNKLVNEYLKEEYKDGIIDY